MLRCIVGYNIKGTTVLFRLTKKYDNCLGTFLHDVLAERS